MTNSIEIPDYVSNPLTLSQLAQLAADLLASNPDLPAPVAVHVAAHGDEIEVQFSGDRATFAAMADWADRFGGTITGAPGADGSGPHVRCEVRFTFRAARVRAYAYVRATA